jgi:plastocyanin
MKMTQILAVAVGLGAALQVASAGSITGTITLKGTPPAEIKLDQAKSDANCGKFHKEAPTTHHYVVGAKGELANVVVMLKGMDGKSTGAKAPAAELDQKGCEYIPSIIAVQTGQTLNVKNSDPVLHNIHVIPDGTSGNPEKNPSQLAGAPPIPMTFAKPEHFVKFKCDVHPWMFAWVTVVDHPYFAVTDKDGKFTIKDVPPGKYTIVAMHRKAAPKGEENSVEVKDGATTVDYTLEVPKQ